MQLPLSLGDAVFFNPALFHAAGSNTTTNVYRMGNLLQVSSAMGRALEAVDRARICLAVYPALLERHRRGWSAEAIAIAVAAGAQGYPFPTNLDRDPPIGGLVPPSQADLVHQALAQEWTPARFADELQTHSDRRLTTPP